MLINWVADVCYATPINETTTDSRRRLLDIPTLDNGNFTVECYRAPGGGMVRLRLQPRIAFVGGAWGTRSGILQQAGRRQQYHGFSRNCCGVSDRPKPPLAL